MKLRHCIECGREFVPRTADNDFCNGGCQKLFLNRRAVRGAAFYDLVMTLRFDRPVATKLKVWKLLCRMAKDYHDEDLRERGDRRTFRHPRKALANKPWLFADHYAFSAGGRRA